MPALTERSLTAPVLLLVFNRPETTRRVFERIRSVKPGRLYVAADGPRADRPGEAARCAEARAVVDVDWDCEVRTDLRDANLGMPRGIVAALDWFFAQEPEGIVLEDDCLPSRSFFWFCQALLERYSEDERVMQISGSNFLRGRHPLEVSYYFSRINDIWGWATWRRAWRHFDARMSTFAAFRAQGRIADYIAEPEIAAWLLTYFDKAAAAGGERGVWSSAWAYALCTQNGLTAVPRVNLVENIGFGSGTHAANSYAAYGAVPAEELDELLHPTVVLPDRAADTLRFEMIRQTDPRLLHRRSRGREFAGRWVPRRYRDALRRLLPGRKERRWRSA